MRIGRSFCALFIALACMACGKETREGTDLYTNGLRGNVKSVSEKKYHAVMDENQEIVRGPFFRNNGEWDCVAHFNKDGNYEEVVYLDRDGDIVERNVYEYGENRKVSTLQIFEDSSTLKKKCLYQYDIKDRVSVIQELDEDGDFRLGTSIVYNDENLIETATTVNRLGTVLCRTITEKNRKGQVSDFKYYNEERKLTNWRKETHDDEGRLSEMVVLHADESLAFKVVNSYNLQGDLVKSEPFSEEEEFLNQRYTYVYDKKSNWISKIQFFGDSAVSVTEREIEYY